jgi:hypothetical protein
MQFLKKLSEHTSHSKSLKFHLHKHLAGVREGRSHKNVHASDLMKSGRDFCPREYCLLDIAKDKKAKGEFLSTSLAMTFAIGIEIEDLVVDWFAEMDKAIGNWKCLTCGAYAIFCKRPERCRTCKSKVFKHEQLRFVSQVSGVSCGVDMVVNLGGLKHTLVEIKTIDKEEFKKLVAPLAEHKFRTSLYPRIVEESDHAFKDRIDTTEAFVFYVSKGGFGCKDVDVLTWKTKGLLQDAEFSPFKEFLIKRNDALTDPRVELASKVLTYRQGGPMPKGICPTQFCDRAHKCAVTAMCFSGKYPHGEKPKS